MYHLHQVQTAVNGLRESAASRTNQLQQEMSIMQDATASVKAEWTNYVEKAESYYLEDNGAVENGKKELEVVLHNWYEMLPVLIFFFFLKLQQ